MIDYLAVIFGIASIAVLISVMAILVWSHWDNFVDYIRGKS